LLELAFPVGVTMNAISTSANVISTSAPVRERTLLLPILVGGLAAGVLDLTSAFILYGWHIPRVIAGGLLGRQALHGGSGTWILGVFLHFLIAFSAATIYCLSSRKLGFLKSNFVVCGLFYGIAVYLTMNLIVLPLSALHSAGPYQLRSLIQGLLVHMLLIGLSISFSAWKFSD
jgi:hypothetical protein